MASPLKLWRSRKRRNGTTIYAKVIDHLDVAKVHNPRRGTWAYLGSTELASKARRMKSPRHQLLNDLVRSGEASPEEFNEWSALHHGFNEAATKRIKQLDAKRKRRNGSKRPAVKQLYESFSGKRAKRQNVVTAPTGTPGNVAQLGRLRLIQTTDGRRWKFSGNDAPFLAADHKQKLHVVGGRYRANPAGEECGEIERIEYETSKPHLGQKSPAIYFHELGEETGERPTLVIDGDGLIRIEGGEYWIEADGIHN